ncbi:hypothetical protein DRN72_01405 [Methanosarcinales archaeon]|nr:MAG: hypothetical protein DRN72_01405 [Methanosarcinales archaeon]
MSIVKVLCGFNSNIDRVIKVSNGVLNELERTGATNVVETILSHMKSGKGKEYVVDRDIALMLSHLRGEDRLGGNAANVAKVLSLLGDEPMLNIVSPDVLPLVPEGIIVPPVSTEGECVHYVFEFERGYFENIFIKNSDRVIFTYDPLNS